VEEDSELEDDATGVVEITVDEEADEEANEEAEKDEVMLEDIGVDSNG
jgi:hypothetical protein